MSHKAVKNIRFHYLVDPFYFPDRSKLKYLLLALFKKEGFQVNLINYIFCDDEYLLKINQQHLRHDSYTDIITFPYSSTGEPLLSDIYISTQRVKANALEFQLPFQHELLRVIIHGALHLAGYRDKTQKELSLMRNREDYYLKRVVPRGTL